jgi:hypothetical protein
MRSELQCKVGEHLNTYLATVDHCDWPDNPTPKAGSAVVVTFCQHKVILPLFSKISQIHLLQ